MFKLLFASTLLGFAVVGGALGYSYFKAPLEASGEMRASTAGKVARERAPDAAIARYEINPAGSQASFSIDEMLQGSSKTVLGTTAGVSGEVAIDPLYPSTASVGVIHVNARTLATDSTQRDRAIKNQVLKTDQNEFIVFTPASLEGLPARAVIGETYEFRMTGALTIAGATKPATFDVTVTNVTADELKGTAMATINYKDWNVNVPQVPIVAWVSDQVTLKFDFTAEAI